MLWRAMQWALKAHEGQLDKGGKPYIEHVLRVAFEQGSYDARVIALLHDVVEDSEASLDDLRQDFPHDIVVQVDAITRRKGERYASYIRRVANYEAASRVKIADLRDNLSPDRRSEAVSDSLVKRYEQALQYLLDYDVSDQE